MYKHIIWDFDGTLFDTYPIMGSLFKKALEEEGIEENLDEILKYMKVSMATAFEHYEKKYNINSEFIEKYKSKREEMEVPLCKPFKGIKKICKYIYTSGKENHLYTHRGKSSIILLKKYNLYNYFCDFITSEDGFERKPSPNAINYIVDKHNILRNEALMIGDRDLDILSAKNAGIQGCLFTDNHKKSDIADFTINNFKQLYLIIS